MNPFLLSIVIPVFQEEQQIKITIHTLEKILTTHKIDYELILVDDGSTDNTWQEIKKIALETSAIRAFRLSRNFGKEAALCAGLEAFRGDACIIMDADLQHPPEMIPEMVRLWREGYQIVEGVKTSRGPESILNRLFAFLFYRTLKKLAGIDLKQATDFKLMDTEVIAAWRQMPEHNTFFRGMAQWVGFSKATVPFDVAPRTTGETKWSIWQLIKLALSAIVSFSTLPLQIVTFIGVIFLLGAIPLFIQTLYMKFSGIAVSGFTTVILLLLITGSAVMICLGIIGTYVAKIYEEVKHRPRYIISEKTDSLSTKE